MSKVLLACAFSILILHVPIAALGENNASGRQLQISESIEQDLRNFDTLSREELLNLELFLLQDSEIIRDGGIANYGLTTGSCPGTAYCEKTVCDFRGPDGVCEYSHTERYCCTEKWNLKYYPVMRD